jgi:hypothetical protein
MTTATDEATKVDLAASNGDAPKRRGRPPGSKNKTSRATTATRTRRAKAAAPAKAATTTRTPNRVHAILVSSTGIEVLREDGTTETFSIGLADAPLFDRRK